MKVLITGGAGFIGSTIASALLDAGNLPVILDDLSKGRPGFLDGRSSYIGDVADPALLDQIFDEHPDIEITIHCAARTSVPESLADPLTYYRHNVAKTVLLVEALLAHDCRRLIFSSSAAVYGHTTERVVTERSSPAPPTPYARSKLMAEQILADVCAATPLRALSLRYFNPIGCDPNLRSGPYERGSGDVIGGLFGAVEQNKPFWIHGRDWDTIDGTPVRDFVHVWDIAGAHVAAIHSWTPSPQTGHDVINIGSGRGTTVRELAETFNHCAPRPVQIRYDERRAGDTAGAYASTDIAQRLLGWRATRTVAEAVIDLLAWAAQSQSPPTRCP